MKNKSLILNIVLPIIIALTCFFPIASYTTNVEHHQKNIEYIDSKKTTVLELTATSAALSVAIDMIPGDTGSSIANALASLTTKFGIVLGALFLEKYLLTLLAYIAFKWIIPICCGAWIVQYLLHIHFLFPLNSIYLNQLYIIVDSHLLHFLLLYLLMFLLLQL